MNNSGDNIIELQRNRSKEANLKISKWRRSPPFDYEQKKNLPLEILTQFGGEYILSGEFLKTQACFYHRNQTYILQMKKSKLTLNQYCKQQDKEIQILSKNIKQITHSITFDQKNQLIFGISDGRISILKFMKNQILHILKLPQQEIVSYQVIPDRKLIICLKQDSIIGYNYQKRVLEFENQLFNGQSSLLYLDKQKQIVTICESIITYLKLSDENQIEKVTQLKLPCRSTQVIATNGDQTQILTSFYYFSGMALDNDLCLLDSSTGRIIATQCMTEIFAEIFVYDDVNNRWLYQDREMVIREIIEG